MENNQEIETRTYSITATKEFLEALDTILRLTAKANEKNNAIADCISVFICVNGAAVTNNQSTGSTTNGHQVF